MRIYSIVSAALGGVLMAGVSATALAGTCGGGVVCNSGFNPNIAPYEGVPSPTCNLRRAPMAAPVENCNPGIVNHGGVVDTLAPVDAYTSAPYGYLKNFAYKNSPNVNVMRVYARPPEVRLNDVPTGFSGGCTPSSEGYCRAGGAAMAPVPVMRQVQRPVMRPVAPAPRVRIGQGYNPANFASRQYGDNILTPGIANIPTSIVDRSPITHIDGVPQQKVRSVTTMNGTSGAGYTMPRPAYNAPVMGGNVIGHVSGGTYTYRTPGTPDYWEKTSGATIVNGLPATQVVCRRSGTPGRIQTVNVVRPVIGVPRPVPTPVAVPVARPTCQQVAGPAPAFAGPVPGSRWTY